MNFTTALIFGIVLILFTSSLVYVLKHGSCSDCSDCKTTEPVDAKGKVCIGCPFVLHCRRHQTK